MGLSFLVGLYIFKNLTKYNASEQKRQSRGKQRQQYDPNTLLSAAGILLGTLSAKYFHNVD